MRTSVPPGRSSVSGRPGDSSAPLDLGLRSHKQAAYEMLRDMIISLEIPPGTRLVETEVAARFGVSKSPIREALLQLETDRLVDVAPYRGATVTWLSTKETEEQSFLVDALEMPAYPLVVKCITDEELAAIDLVANEVRQARADGDGLRFGKLASSIHSMLFACLGYRRLDQMIRMTLGPVGMRYDMVVTYPDPDSWDCLRDMALARYEAIRTRDAELVAREVRTYRAKLSAMTSPRVTEPANPEWWAND